MDNTGTPKNKDYQKIMGQLDDLMKHLPSEEDKQLLSNMVSECYYKNYGAIMSMEKDDPSLISPLIMALLVDQQSMIDQLEDNKC
ncbi:MAG: hypothetical protein WKF36_11535 [Candidatus Nitrosocosmicus sp.]